jgi:hypothetical protein
MDNLSPYAIQLLKDVVAKPGRFEFVQGSDGSWPRTPYGSCNNPQESLEIGRALEELRNMGLIRELIPNGGTFEITSAGIGYAQGM